MITPEETTVFILAAGRGKRMMPLTENLPKPLLTIAGVSLIEHHLDRLATLGFKKFVINVDYLGEKIMKKLRQGQQWNVNIEYSDERTSGALETAGGIRKAIGLIKSDSFLCLNADIWTDFNFAEMLKLHNQSTSPATIVLTDNPPHHPEGDFRLNISSNKVLNKEPTKPADNTYTFTGIGMYSKHLFSPLKNGKHALGPLLKRWSDEQSLDGYIHPNEWYDIGTPERLEMINQRLSSD